MRKRYSLFIVYLFCSLTVSAQHMQETHFVNGGIYFTIKNTFSRRVIDNSGRVMHCLQVYGDSLTVTAADIEGFIFRRVSGGWLNGGIPTALRVPYADVQVFTSLNDSTIQRWTPIRQLPVFTSNEIVHAQDTGQKIQGNVLVRERLENGDTMRLALRVRGQSTFEEIYFIKKEWDTQPYLRGFRAVANETETTARVALAHMNSMSSTGWPGSGGGPHGEAYAHNIHFTLYFRPRATPGDSAFEDRLWRNNKTKGWFKGHEVLSLGRLKPGSAYVLQVRFAKNPEHGSIYSFKTQPEPWQENIWVRIIGGLLLATMLTLGFVVIRLLVAKRRADRYQLETRALYAQMNPHFLFNALSTIQGLMNDAQIEKANHYLNGFASLMRGTIEMGSKETVPLAIELKNLEHYIHLEKMRFNFNYELTTNPHIPVDELEVPPLLAQPLIENAVKHGIAGKREKGILLVKLHREGKDLLMTISDNGKGFDTTAATTGYGLQLTRERIKLFNTRYGSYKIELQTRSDQDGTTTVLHYKNWLQHD
jgi:two-component system, LytTR family, sensor kinase